MMPDPMAPRRPLPPKPERPVLTVQQKRICIERFRKRIEDLEGFDPQTVQKRFTSPEVTALQNAIDEALSAAFGHGTTEYNRYASASRILLGAYAIGGQADELASRPLSEQFDMSRAAVEGLHPGRSRELEKPMAVAWSKMPYSLGFAARFRNGQESEYSLLNTGQCQFPSFRPPNGNSIARSDYISRMMIYLLSTRFRGQHSEFSSTSILNDHLLALTGTWTSSSPNWAGVISIA
jgi:hypothetical protein